MLSPPFLPRRSSLQYPPQQFAVSASHRNYLPPPDLFSGRRASAHSLRDYQLSSLTPTPPLANLPHRVATSEANIKTQPSPDVMQALEIARESEDGATDPVVAKMLDQALDTVWDKVQAQPESYIMSHDEFSLFNYFQHRFIGDNLAVLARRRYWENASAAK
ncbi:hypothetical protein Golomagni_05577 [Golovinomyces magnicellulatus]|nr:hypothetical protein Golomagni_05577 [Golovinomyces magnicellulatus]